MTEPDCVFCRIIEGDADASVVLETDAAIAIMDPRQANPGHVLVIPKQHFPDIYALSPEAGSHLMEAIVLVSRAVEKAFPPDGLSIWQSNGPAAYQEIPHVHFHVHPRLTDDGLLRVYPSAPNLPPKEERDRLAAQIREQL